ncbi:uncharacterized protein [Dermacentor andersoni]|uniref:uncharacterized protein n=1 Tax=Dermacentor andersoni TaxID=34620 RepID=UPI0024174239|nr:adult-specific rigid cuticular protein 15.5-like [Dermacentor andersoni]
MQLSQRYASLRSTSCVVFRRGMFMLIAQTLVTSMGVFAQDDNNYLQPEYQQSGYDGAEYGEPSQPVYPPTPYNFGYDTEDEYGNKQFHKEEGDSNNIKTGSYGYTDANGLYRRVNYVADATGFHVTITTNEPGTAPGRSANAIYNAHPVVVPPVVGRASASGHVLSYLVAPSYLVKPAPYESLALGHLGYPAHINGEYGRRKRSVVYRQ